MSAGNVDRTKEWIKHAKSEGSAHVSIPIVVAEELIAEVARVRELPAVAGSPCLAENPQGFVCTMQAGHYGPHRIVLTFDHIALLVRRGYEGKK